MEEDLVFQRLQKEFAEIDERLQKLNAFNDSEQVERIPKLQRDLLAIQAGAMYTYRECLRSRIENFNTGGIIDGK